MTSHILLHHEQGITTLTLNRPKQHNAFHPELVADLLDAIITVDQDKQTRVLILTGANHNFSAGADLKWMQQSIHYTARENFADAEKLSQLMNALYHLSKPTIALIQGAAMGGAIGLIACCDIAVATTDAYFCFSEVKLGLAPAVISPYVIAAIGPRAAQRYFLTAERFTADTAHQIGLIHTIAADYDELLKTGKTFSQQFLNNAPQAITQCKKLIKTVAHSPINDATREMTARLIANMRITDEAQAGLKAFLTKQAPPWQVEK